jgi:DNA-binding MarR family transcriptional regulator
MASHMAAVPDTGRATGNRAQRARSGGAGRARSGGAETARLAAWHDLMDRYARTMSMLERRLEAEHGLGVSEYEVLERLASPDKDERRMQELAEAVHLSQSALSRVVGRLEADGLVKRGMCAEDRRGIYACLTDAGRARYEAAKPTHRAVLADTLG